MLRTVVHKKDSFLVKYILHNELTETLVKPYIETNVDTNLFDIEHKGVQGKWWHPAASGNGFVWAEILRAKDNTPEGYYRFKNPIAYYKLASDADTDPWRAVSLTPVDVILTTKHVVLVIDKPNWDSTRPYADTILEKLRSVFRVVEKDEPTDGYDISEIMGCYRVTNGVNRSYISDCGINFGGSIYPYTAIYKSETVGADVLGTINVFGFNVPDQITVAKAGETIYYYDLKYMQDNELIPIVVDANDPTKAYVVVHMITPKVLIAENSFLQDDEIYNLLANILALLNVSNYKLDYYSESTLKDTFELPYLLCSIWINPFYTTGVTRRADGRLNVNLSSAHLEIGIRNVSNDIKTVATIKTYTDGSVLNTQTIDPPMTVAVMSSFSRFTVDISSAHQTIVTNETVGTGDGSTAKFKLSKTPVKEESEKIYVNGALKTRGTDYTIDYESGEITFTTAPADGATITADYVYYVPLKIAFLDPDGNELAKLERLATFE